MYRKSFWETKDYRIAPYTVEHKDSLLRFCQQAAIETHKLASKNMDVFNLFNVLESENRFHNGQFFLFYLEDRIIAVSGYHKSEFDPHTFFCGVRTYTLAEFEYNGIHSNFLLPEQIKACHQLGAKKILFVFNEYNSKLYKFMQNLQRILRESLHITFEIEAGEKKIFYKGVWQHLLMLDFDPAYTLSLPNQESNLK